MFVTDHDRGLEPRDLAADVAADLRVVEDDLPKAARLLLVAEHEAGHLVPRAMLDPALGESASYRTIRAAEGKLEELGDAAVVALGHELGERWGRRLFAVPLRAGAELRAVVVIAATEGVTAGDLYPAAARLQAVTATIEHRLDAMRAASREEEAARLIDIGRALAASAQIPRLAPVIAEVAATVTGFTRATVMLWQRDGRLLGGASRLAGGQPDLRLWGLFRAMGRPVPAMEKAMADGIPYVSTSPETDAALEPERWIHRLGIETVVVVPVLDGQQRLGVIVLDAPHRICVAPSQLRAAERAAEQAAVVVGLAQIVRSERVGRQRAQLVLGTVVQAATQLNTTGVLSVVAEGVNAIVTDMTTVAFTRKNGRATGIATAGVGDGTVDLLEALLSPEVVADLGFDPFGAVHAPARQILVDDSVPRLRDLGVGRILVVPVSRAAKELGWVVSFDRRQDRYLEDDLRVVGGMAAQAALSLHTAHLLEGERAAVARLEELDRLKTAFVAAVSHELRTPLTAIVGYSDILAEELSDPVLSGYVADMRREASVLEALIGNLLDTSRLEAGMLQLNMRAASLGAIVAEAVDVVRHGHRERRIDLVSADIPELLLDTVRLRQVFINLIENAVKYSPAEGTITVTIDPDDAASLVRVYVDDEGPGVPVEHREAIFQRFHRLPSDREKPGTGIGLYLVRALVEAHGGTVHVTDRPDDSGARFVVELPLVPA